MHVVVQLSSQRVNHCKQYTHMVIYPYDPFLSLARFYPFYFSNKGRVVFVDDHFLGGILFFNELRQLTQGLPSVLETDGAGI